MTSHHDTAPDLQSLESQEETRSRSTLARGIRPSQLGRGGCVGAAVTIALALCSLGGVINQLMPDRRQSDPVNARNAAHARVLYAEDKQNALEGVTLDQDALKHRNLGFLYDPTTNYCGSGWCGGQHVGEGSGDCGGLCFNRRKKIPPD